MVWLTKRKMMTGMTGNGVPAASSSLITGSFIWRWRRLRVQGGLVDLFPDLYLVTFASFSSSVALAGSVVAQFEGFLASHVGCFPPPPFFFVSRGFALSVLSQLSMS